uniref:Probable magnesium transporter n=1 Tax=Zea mays TaxID=4577 RepID=A0A804PR54_MAIZE
MAVATCYSNFIAYIFAPGVLVTPLGALSIIVSSVLAHFVLKERLEKLGVLGCVSCINLATQPGFLAYVVTALLLVGALVLFFEPRYAIGVSIKLTLDGVNQAAYPYTWLFLNCLWGFSNKLPEQGNCQPRINSSAERTCTQARDHVMPPQAFLRALTRADNSSKSGIFG